MILNFLFLFGSLSAFTLIAAEIEECDKLMIEGGAKAVKKIFTDSMKLGNDQRIKIKIVQVGANISSK
ncbi:hypothetical protein DOY81_012235, partial [Sarcophaga bullata]